MIRTLGCFCWRRPIAAASLIICLSAVASTASDGAQPAGTPLVHVVARAPGDSPEAILAKAARIVPNHPQQLYHRDEFSAFIHFGPNTFTGVEWGNGRENPAVFNPGETLDTDQWCEVLRSAGMRKVILTAKHHDGFCLWQTRYNEHFSVRAVPWKNGQGDVLRELARSCHKAGLKLGIYLSPADLYHIEDLQRGLYGNGSTPQESIIPTAAEALQSNPMLVRPDRPAEAPTFQVSVDDYNRYFMNQLYEILTEYGPIHEVWFDGAHPKRKGGQTYAKKEWFAMIRRLAPEATIFGGPDIRWCGNEGGHTREAEWSILPTQSEEVSGEDRPDAAPGSDEAICANGYQVYGVPYESRELRYLIAEVNTSIREGWFWRNDDEQSVRSPDDVFDIYERAVGGNAGFLLNVPPNREGRIAIRDAICLAEVGRRIRETYARDLLESALIDHVPQAHDNDLSTYWQSTSSAGELLVTLPHPVSINRWVLQEAIFVVGQRIKQHALDAWIEGQWREIAHGTTVGYKRILRFPTVNSDRFRLRVLDARLQPTIAEMSAYFYRQPPLPVAITSNVQGEVSIAPTLVDAQFEWNRGARPIALDADPDAKIVYSLDDTPPTAESSIYAGPFLLPQGGRVQARTISHGELGTVSSVLLELARSSWRISSVSGQLDAEHSGAQAIDGDANTLWIATPTDSATASGSFLIVDLGKAHSFGGLTYLPPHGNQRQQAHGIERGHVEVSLDGETWMRAGSFEFGNLVNDPSLRTHRFAATQRARWVRLTVERLIDRGTHAGVAELGLLPASE